MKKGNYALNEDIFPYLEKNQLAVGISFAYMMEDVEMEIKYKDKTYKRLHTESMPTCLVGDFFSVQIYELVE